ncbi:MAG: polyprenyl synthetase [Phycisphaeraceae bacterium]|nr:MAG: polyprenyl synthetase [Phycisphaeraceae bacterium]
MRGVMDIPDELAPAAAAVGNALERVESTFAAALETDHKPVADLCSHVERYRGKMLRPVLAIASGLATHPNAELVFATGEPDALVNSEMVTVGAVVEMVHMATLVHDDILDEADVRRRGATVNNLHGNEPAVILGDYLIATAYHLCSTLPDRAYSLAVGRASQVVCAGELLQLHHREDWTLDEDRYFAIIEGKTGALTAVACELGARAAGAGDDARAALAQYGQTLGNAFQIQDDLLDLAGTEERVGKSVGKDLEKGKLTLPLIHHLRTANADQRARSLAWLDGASHGGDGEADLRAAIQGTGSIDYARETAVRLVTRAKGELDVLPNTPARGLLGRLADAVTDRAY